MKNLIILSLLLIPLVSSSTSKSNDYSSAYKRAIISCVKKSSTERSDLTENKAVFEFEFTNINDDKSHTLLYSIDGVNSETQVKRDELLSIETTPGKHSFQFYMGSKYEELQLDSLLIEAKHCDQYLITFERYIRSTEPRLVYKPVIYLYPEKETDVSVTVNIHGTDPFFYPTYSNGWKCKAQPNGDLIIGKNTYNYLFWEAKVDNSFNLSDSKTGSIVEGENVIDFLDKKLDEAGLTSKEKADFITFWGPKLAAEKLTFIHFLFNEECDRYADLTISPTPDNLYRLYIVWSPIDKAFPIIEQKMTPINRNGFMAFEWGGHLSSFQPTTLKRKTTKAIK